jgi:hypothetical protein
MSEMAAANFSFSFLVLLFSRLFAGCQSSMSRPAVGRNEELDALFLSMPDEINRVLRSSRLLGQKGITLFVISRLATSVWRFLSTEDE